MMKIGIYGGTFDPVHNGHKYIVETFKKELCLDLVIIVPSYNPNWREKPRYTFNERRKMLSNIFKNDNSYIIAAIEKVYEINVTIDVIRKVKENCKILYNNGTPIEFYFLIGEDNLYDLKNWYKPKELIKEVQLVVIKRLGCEKKTVDKWLQNSYIILESKFEQNVSATLVRNLIKNNEIETLRKFIPLEAYNYIKNENL